MGYPHHLNNRAGYTGILMLSKHPLTNGAIEAPIPHRWLHAVSDHWGLEIAALYGPLPNTVGNEPTMKEFWNWLVPACDDLVDRNAVLCGDFNTGISHVDGPEDYRFKCESQFGDLRTHGWRDAYRELHPDGRQCSWWNKERGFRIDHCMISRRQPAPSGATYTHETAGIRLTRQPSDASSMPAISDHAALVLDF